MGGTKAGVQYCQCSRSGLQASARVFGDVTSLDISGAMPRTARGGGGWGREALIPATSAPAELDASAASDKSILNMITR